MKTAEKLGENTRNIRGFYCYGYPFLKYYRSKKIGVAGKGRIRLGVKYTIRENHLFSKAYSKGKKFVGRRVVVYLLPDYAASRLAKADPKKRRHNRIGITVTKKFGGAVERSRARRIIRAGLAEAEKTPIKQGFLIVIAARSSAANAKSGDIAADLRIAFEKLGLSGATDLQNKKP